MERTFHQHASPLHGITVAVEILDRDDSDGLGEAQTRRFDEDAERVILLDADRFPPADGDGAPDGSAASKDEWLARAARFGVWPRHPRVVLPRGRVSEIRRLGELE